MSYGRTIKTATISRPGEEDCLKRRDSAIVAKYVSHLINGRRPALLSRDDVWGCGRAKLITEQPLRRQSLPDKIVKTDKGR